MPLGAAASGTSGSASAPHEKCGDADRCEQNRLRYRGYAGDSTTCRKYKPILIADVGVDHRRVVIDVHLAVIVEIAVGPAAQTCCDTRVDLDVVIDIDLPIQRGVAAVGVHH